MIREGIIRSTFVLFPCFIFFKSGHHRYKYIVFDEGMLVQVFLEETYMVQDIVPEYGIAGFRKIFHHDVLQVAELLVDVAVVLLELKKTCR